MENCIQDIRNWLIKGRLLLNDDKTEFRVIGTREQLNKLNPSVLQVGDLMMRGALGSISNRKTGRKILQNRKTAMNFY